jgi:hypothetical protein
MAVFKLGRAATSLQETGHWAHVQDGVSKDSYRYRFIPLSHVVDCLRGVVASLACSAARVSEN